MKTDGHQDLVGVVSGQEGHEHVLRQKNTEVSLILYIFSVGTLQNELMEHAWHHGEMKTEKSPSLSPCLLPWRPPGRLAPGWPSWSSWCDWRTPPGWQSGTDPKQVRQSDISMRHVCLCDFCHRPERSITAGSEETFLLSYNLVTPPRRTKRQSTFVSLPNTLEWKQIQWSETNIRPW